VIFNNLFAGEFISVTDKYIIQIDKLIKSFYSGLLNSNNSPSGRYSLVLVGLRTKYQVNTSVVVNPATNVPSNNVVKMEEEKLYRVWYVLSKFNRNSNGNNEKNR
jgi:hypothetical protein